MSDQLALVGPATPPDLKLTARQRLALEFIAQKPCSSEELGAVLHEHRLLEGGRGHGRDSRCNWCKAEGASMGSRLRKDGLVKFARAPSVWYLAENDRPKVTREPQSDDIPY